MKNYLIISLLFLSLGFSQKEYNVNDLIKMDNGLWTEKFSDKPLTGKVYGGFGEDKPLKKVYIGNLLNGKKEGKWISYYHSTGKKKYDENYKDGELDGLSTSWYDNGQKKNEGTFKDGKLDGLNTQWYENGQKKNEGTYKDGELDGKLTFWYENGQKESELTYKDGELNGLTTSWYDNGQEELELTYKDGKEDGLVTSWYENGQKKTEGTYKDGELDGLWTVWYENGQKKSEVNYKDGKEISSKSEKSFHRELKNLSNQMNKTCPVIIDKYTTLMNTIVISEKLFYYNYIINKNLFNDFNITESQWRKNKVTQLTSFYCNDSDFKVYKDNNVSVIWKYNYEDGLPITKIEINNNDCYN